MEVVGTKRAVVSLVWAVTLVGAWAVPSPASPRPYPSLFVVPADGGTPVELGYSEYSSAFSWAAGGDALVFASASGGIQVAELGPGPARVLTEDWSDDHPAWSPSGDEILFVRWLYGYAARLFLVDADGGEPVRFLDLQGHERAPSWSPDGSAVAFYHSIGETTELRVAPADGSTSRVLVSGAIQIMDPPQWDPTGTQILYTKAGPGDSIDVYAAAADGSGERRITSTPAVEFRPRWSPDGSRIAYGTTEGIFVTDAAGTAPVLVRPGGSGPAWSPDGTRIAFDDGFDVMTMDPDGSDERVVVEQAWARNFRPQWSPSGDSLAYLTQWMDTRAPCESIERNDSKPRWSGGSLVSGDGGDDALTGTAGGDYFCAFAGDDLVQGGDGADVVFGDAGADEIEGGPGPDVLLGDGTGELAEAPRRPVGDDVLTGGEGPDLLKGGRGDDVLAGGRDTDELRGGPGRDECYARRADRVKGCEVVVRGPYRR